MVKYDKNNASALEKPLQTVPRFFSLRFVTSTDKTDQVRFKNESSNNES